MLEEQLHTLSEEMADLNIVLIFLNEAKQRTINLKNDSTKHDFPDLDYRIGRIESAISRFQPRLNEIRAAIRAETKAREENK